MRITVLTIPECPNAPLAQERVTAALDGRAAEVQLVEVRDQAEAARWGMTGSPTVLLDGVDPFANAGSEPSVSCRVYRGAAGAADGAPSVAALRQALDEALAGQHPQVKRKTVSQARALEIGVQTFGALLPKN